MYSCCALVNGSILCVGGSLNGSILCVGGSLNTMLTVCACEKVNQPIFLISLSSRREPFHTLHLPALAHLLSQ